VSVIDIRQGHVLDVLAEMPAESIDCVVTSPPYWGLRDAGGGLKRLNDTIDVCSIHRDRAIATGGQIQIVEKSTGFSGDGQHKLPFDSSCSTTRKDNP